MASDLVTAVARLVERLGSRRRSREQVIAMVAGASTGVLRLSRAGEPTVVVPVFYRYRPGGLVTAIVTGDNDPTLAFAADSDMTLRVHGAEVRVEPTARPDAAHRAGIVQLRPLRWDVVSPVAC